MNRHKLLQVMASVTLVVLFLVGCGAPVATPTPVVIVVTATPQATPTPAPPTATPVPPTPTPGPPSAIVVDTNGKTYEVTDLSAKYTAGGMWIGSRPERIRESLFIVLYFVKDRITTTEELEIPFASMRRLVFSGAPLPEEFKEIFEGQAPIRIDMWDGTVILLSGNLLVEIDAQGNQTKAVEFDSYSFKAGETQGQDITLDGFSGRAKTENGKEGDFWISDYETQSIEFREP